MKIINWYAWDGIIKDVRRAIQDDFSQVVYRLPDILESQELAVHA
jgi:hypothetical protein